MHSRNHESVSSLSPPLTHILKVPILLKTCSTENSKLVNQRPTWSFPVITHHVNMMINLAVQQTEKSPLCIQPFTFSIRAPPPPVTTNVPLVGRREKREMSICSYGKERIKGEKRTKFGYHADFSFQHKRTPFTVGHSAVQRIA